jgi:hypothetical protein
MSEVSPSLARTAPKSLVTMKVTASSVLPTTMEGTTHPAAEPTIHSWTVQMSYLSITNEKWSLLR